LFFLPSFVRHSAFAPSNRFLALNAAQFAFRNEPSLAADSAQHTAAGDFFPEALHHLFLRFIRSEINSYSQDFSHPFFSAFMHKGRGLCSHPLMVRGLNLFGIRPKANLAENPR
jgi:hypothetical protein